MKYEEFSTKAKSLFFLDLHKNVYIIPEEAVYRDNDKFTRKDFDYYKLTTRKIKEVFDELTIEANNLSLSEIRNILKQKKHYVSKDKVIREFYSKNDEWSGKYKNPDKKAEIVNKANKEVEDIKKNHSVLYFRINVYDKSLTLIKRDGYELFFLKGEVYFINALKKRKNAIYAEIKDKRGKNKRIQRIKDKKSEKGN